MLEALRLAESGALAGAIELLGPVVSQNPRNLQALDALGTSLCLSKRWAEAHQVLTRRVELNPRSAQAWVNLADAVAHLGDLAAAERALETALSHDPAHPAARRMLELLRAR